MVMTPFFKPVFASHLETKVPRQMCPIAIKGYSAEALLDSRSFVTVLVDCAKLGLNGSTYIYMAILKDYPTAVPSFGKPSGTWVSLRTCYTV